MSATIKLAAQQVLADGWYMSTVYDSTDSARRQGTTVLVIEYALHNAATPTEDSYRLITTLLDADGVHRVDFGTVPLGLSHCVSRSSQSSPNRPEEHFGSRIQVFFARFASASLRET